MVQNVLALFLIGHFFACVWFWIGHRDKDSEASWVITYGLDIAGFAERYMVSIHWSLTQFTPGGMPVQPQNMGERACCVGVLAFALCILSTFVSSITTSMSR